MKQQREQWTSKLGFILAAAGSAIGLGAIWKFPYIAGTNGGGAFLFVFILFTLLVGMPILLAEFAIGRSAQKDAISAYKFLTPGTAWPWLGRIGIVSSFIILSFYSVVGGWIFIYLLHIFLGNLQIESAEQFNQLFSESIMNPYLAVGGQLIFMILTIWVVGRGVQKGIERASQIMMPALFICFIILIIRSLTLPNVGEGISFFLLPDFGALNSKTIIYALGHSFFALSVGNSVMVTYSSYLEKNTSLSKSATVIVIMNIVISLLAGLAIFPAVFSLGMEPTEGPGLLFVVLPAVFNEMHFGMVFLFIFLILFLFATLTSAFSLLEIIVAVFSKDKPKRRKKVTWITGILIFLAGVPSALSFGVLKDTTIINKSIFDTADFLASNILLPIGALFIALYAAFKLPKSLLLNELTINTKHGKIVFTIWYFLIRYIAPTAIIIVFLDSIGMFDWMR
ncbi:sodium-dependent transporter [Lederbergia graminis]|uniref:Transporter n=1 Tax=Lederbergia graminis TaxID=735518 RepID=A0ABW0LCF7_9BACI